MGPGDLAEALAGLPLQTDPNILAGMERSEDAGIYKLTDELAIIQTVDFFTPIVDDPYSFGQVAAANALSDVYAMGGRPMTALNIVCFPQKTMPMSVLRDVLRGGLGKVHEAGVVLLGGHSVEDSEMKYGLSVTGTIHPGKVVHNSGARPGDKLVLTKPLGTGIISTAIKGGAAAEAAEAGIVASMSTLNDKASAAMLAAGAHACTDITGFGLLGHACEMVQDTGIGMVIEAKAVPCFAEAKEMAGMGMLPGGLHRNREYRQGMVDIDQGVEKYLADILYDPQTSGGLLISVAAEKAEGMLKRLHRDGVKQAAVIGEVVGEPKGRIRVR